jgi:ABC-2 type transport system ATP-binding protein
VEKVCSHVIVIRNGVTLYQGTVDGITANEGFFELESENLEQLKSALQHFSQIEKIEKDENKLLVYLNDNLEPAELNSYLFQQNITLTHLVKRKHSLEEQFLELTKQS